MSYVCPYCKHNGMNGCRCPICNMPNEATHERLPSTPKGQNNWSESEREESNIMAEKGFKTER